MTTVDASAPQTHAFEADVAKLLHLMVHSVYSDKDIFLRELISNAADACEKLRYEAIAAPELLADDPQPRVTLIADAEGRRLTIEDNGIGMTRRKWSTRSAPSPAPAPRPSWIGSRPARPTKARS